MKIQIPFFIIDITVTSCWFKHQWSGWIENLNSQAINSRYRQCHRCGAFEVESLRKEKE